MASLSDMEVEDLADVQQRFHSAIEQIETLQLGVPEEQPGPELLQETSSSEDKKEITEEDLEQSHLQARLHAANEHIESLQTQVTERDQQIILLQQQINVLVKFQHKLTLDVFSEDKVADILNKELKLTRIKANKLSADLLTACQHLQHLHARNEDLVAELAGANDANAKVQRQVAALKKLVVTKMKDNNNLLGCLENAKRMLQEVPQLLHSFQDKQSELEASASKSAEEVERVNKELEESKAQAAARLRSGGEASAASSAELAKMAAEVEQKGQLLKAALRELEETNTHHQELSRALSLKDDSVHHLTRQVHCLEAELKDVRTELERMHAEKATAPLLLDLSFDDPDGKQEKMAKQVAKLKEELAESKKKLKEVQTASARTESQVLGLKTVLATKSTQCHRLETELRVSESRLRDLTTKHETLASECARQLDAASQLSAELQAKLDQKSRQTITVERQLLHAKSQVADLQESLGMEGSPLLLQTAGLGSYAPSNTSNSPTWHPLPGAPPAWISAIAPPPSPAPSSAPSSATAAAFARQLPELLAAQAAGGDRYGLPHPARQQLESVQGLLRKLGATVVGSQALVELDRAGAPSVVGSFPLAAVSSVS